MSWKRRIVRLLDRPGGRGILGKLATRSARRRTGIDAAIFYDAIWVHRVRNRYFPDGPRFDYDAGVFNRWAGEDERNSANAREYWFRFRAPKPGDTVVDIGAGRGEDLIAFSEAVGPTGRVIAIEAHPRTFAVLEHFCRLNRLANVTPLNIAVMDAVGTVTISDTEAWEENAVSRSDGRAGHVVSANSLGAICAEHAIPTIDFLKMNIEGAEQYALLGMKDVVDRIGTICVACHDFRADLGHGEEFRTRDFVARFFANHGFTLNSRPHHPMDYVRDHLFGTRGN